MPGWLGDRYGRFNTSIAFTLLSIILVFGAWIAAPWSSGRIVFAALYGFSSGTFVSMVPTLIAQVCLDMRELGSYIGAVYLIIAPSVLITQPIAGVLADAGHGYERDPFVWLKVFCGLATTVGAIGFVFTRAAYKGRVWGLLQRGKV